jgi:hypothetical protein
MRSSRDANAAQRVALAVQQARDQVTGGSGPARGVRAASATPPSRRRAGAACRVVFRECFVSVMEGAAD